jgi:hypothetical protein
MRKLALTALTLGLLAGSPAASLADGPRPVSGMVTDVDLAARTVEIGGDTYFVPAGVYDLSRLQPGHAVILRWKHVGNRMVATHVEPRPSEG